MMANTCKIRTNYHYSIETSISTTRHLNIVIRVTNLYNYEQAIVNLIILKSMSSAFSMNDLKFWLNVQNVLYKPTQRLHNYRNRLLIDQQNINYEKDKFQLSKNCIENVKFAFR